MPKWADIADCPLRAVEGRVMFMSLRKHARDIAIRLKRSKRLNR